MIDPPGGWKYGFPKPLTQWHGQSLRDWLLQEGYPEKDIELAVKRSRYLNPNNYLLGK